MAKSTEPNQWNNAWPNVESRPYSFEDVARLRGTLRIQHTLADLGARKFRNQLNSKRYVSALGAATGNQAVQMVEAGLGAIYVSGWQVAADANLSGNTYPDMGLYPSNSVPQIVRRINKALQRADQIQSSEGKSSTDWFVPIVADAEAGFGGPLNSFEIMKEMIEAGAAAVHFEDQLASEKKCGHLGGKVLVPTNRFIRTLIAARLAADVCDVPTVIIARTDAEAATLVSSDADPMDHKFLTGERTPEGYYRTKKGLDAAIARGIAYAPYADLIWCETSTPNLEDAQKFAEGVHAVFPGKPLAYNCSPSFNWGKQLDSERIKSFQQTLASYGYRFQFITLAGFHTLNLAMFDLAKGFADEGMPAYARFQQQEFDMENEGYRGVKHQNFVGTAYYDQVAEIIAAGKTSTTAMKESTEKAQFTREEKEVSPGIRQPRKSMNP